MTLKCKKQHCNKLKEDSLYIRGVYKMYENLNSKLHYSIFEYDIE